MIEQKIITQLKGKLSKHCVRDLGLLSSCLFCESHNIMNKIFSAHFSMLFCKVKNNQLTFYRSKAEYDDFSKKVGDQFKNDEIFLNQTAENLINYSDWFYKKINDIKTYKDFYVISKEFFNTVEEFFAYHQAIYWGGDYLTQTTSSKSSERIISKLNKAYEYNEMVVPKIEALFRKFNIANYLSEEVGKNFRPSKNRSILLIDNKRYMLNEEESNELEKNISEYSFDKKQNTKGLGVSSGLYQGKVQLIIDQNYLSESRKGAVLVTYMTRPQFNQSIKNVGAIITDEGGTLCHAAILAREFKIPCIVGTKIATKVLHDGDLVEIDANKGTVKILERK